MDLVEKLNAMQAKKREQLLESVRSGEIPDVGRASDVLGREGVAGVSGSRLLDLLPHGCECERAEGKLLVFRSTMDIVCDTQSFAYRLPLGEPEILARGDLICRLYPEMQSLGEYDATRVAFIDTETTGLAGGTGTVAFLIGLGWFEREEGELRRFVVEQYLIDDYCHESAQLGLLNERLAGFDSFCTYNGRGFDLPLLKARFVMNRMRPSLLNKPMMDLLPFSRRLWRGAFESVSLSSVEKNVLGIERESDIDGALIPEVWMNFVRTGHCGRLPHVLHHNAQDIISMGSLLALQAGCLERPEDPGVLRRASECRGLGRWFEREGDLELSARLYWRAIDLLRDDAEELKLLLHLGKLYRRQNNWERAVEIWRGIQTRPLCEALPAWVEMAKYYEHRVRDLRAARLLLHQCLRQLELEDELRMAMGRTARGLGSSKQADDLRRRLGRVEKKIAKLEAKQAGKSRAVNNGKSMV